MARQAILDDSERIEKVEDVARMGDELTVMVTGIDDQGKIRLSRQAVLEGWTAEELGERDRRGGSRPSGSGRARGSGNRSDRRDNHHGGGRR